MIEEEIEAVAKQKADDIIKKVSNLESYCKRLERETTRMAFSVERDSAQIDAYFAESDEIEKAMEADGFDPESPEGISKQRRLEYIQKKTSKYTKTLLTLNINNTVLRYLYAEERRRLQEEAARLKKEYETKKAILDSLMYPRGINKNNGF